MTRLSKLTRQRDSLARQIVRDGETRATVGHLITLQKRIDKIKEAT